MPEVFSAERKSNSNAKSILHLPKINNGVNRGAITHSLNIAHSGSSTTLNQKRLSSVNSGIRNAAAA